jgi:hypothetical protein
METVKIVISLLALVVSVLALFWGDAIRRLFVRPKLSVSLVSGGGYKTVWNNEIPMYFYHLRVKNSSQTPAMKVEVLLMRLQTAPSFGANWCKPVDFRNRIQLAWPYPNLPNHQQRPNIGPDDEYVCDLGHLEKKINEEPVFMLQTYIKPDNFESLRPREKMRLEIKAVAENAVSELLWLEIYWDGVWTDDSTSLAQHFLIKEIPSPMAD